VHLRSDRRFELALPPDALWDRISDVTAYRRWWPWLREFQAGGLSAGERWRCSVRPPLPYVVRFTVHIDDLVDRESIDVTVAGDIAGTARLEIRDHPVGSEARLVSALSPDHRLLRLLTAAARPMVRFGHDWVLDSGARQFAQRAATEA
jgi:hypothetical protein